MKKYIDASSTCFLLTLADFCKLISCYCPVDTEIPITKVMVTSQFIDTLKILQTENNELILSNLQSTIAELIDLDVAKQNLNNPSTMLLNNNLTLTYRFISSNILALDLCH